MSAAGVRRRRRAVRVGMPCLSGRSPQSGLCSSPQTSGSRKADYGMAGICIIAETHHSAIIVAGVLLNERMSGRYSYRVNLARALQYA